MTLDRALESVKTLQRPRLRGRLVAPGRQGMERATCALLGDFFMCSNWAWVVHYVCKAWCSDSPGRALCKHNPMQRDAGNLMRAVLVPVYWRLAYFTGAGGSEWHAVGSPAAAPGMDTLVRAHR